MRGTIIRLTREEAKMASDANLWAISQYSIHLILAVMGNFKRSPDMDSQNGMYAAYYFLKHIFADASAKAEEINLPGLAKCFKVFNGMPENSVMEESLGMANPKIPHEVMLETLKDALNIAREQCYIARHAIDTGSGLYVDDEISVISTIADVTGIPMDKISLETKIEDLPLDDRVNLMKLSKLLAEGNSLKEDFLMTASPETVKDILQLIYP